MVILTMLIGFLSQDPIPTLPPLVVTVPVIVTATPVLTPTTAAAAASQNEAQFLGVVIMASVTLVVALLGGGISIHTARQSTKRDKDRQAADLLAKSKELEQHGAELKTSEALTLRGMLESQSTEQSSLRAELYQCQQQHVAALAANRELMARVAALEDNKNFLTRQLEEWVRLSGQQHPGAPHA